jgi:hypothetical protein
MNLWFEGQTAVKLWFSPFVLSSLRRGGAGLEAEAVIAGFNDMAVMCETIQHGCCHFGVAKNACPFAKAQIGRDRDAAPLVKLAEQMEQQCSA